jgi:hypothetical protein
VQNGPYPWATSLSLGRRSHSAAAAILWLAKRCALMIPIGRGFLCSLWQAARIKTGPRRATDGLKLGEELAVSLSPASRYYLRLASGSGLCRAKK